MTDIFVKGQPSDVEMARFLQPVDVDAPCGASLRYAPIYRLISEARHEEDASLPMGDWERPLKKADWRAVQRLCEQALLEQSKDLQIACWLMESWLRQNGIVGLVAGANLLQGLVSQFWDDVHPLPDSDGDLETRAAPFSWANTQLEQILLMHVPLFPYAEKTPAFISLDDWQHALAAEFSGASDSDDESVVTRAELLECALSHLAHLAELDTDIAAALKAWKALATELDFRFGHLAPSVSKVTAMLEKMQLAIRSLLQNRDPRLQPALAPVQLPATDEESYIRHGASAQNIAMPIADTGSQVTSVADQITNRDQAYQLLEMVAKYLEMSEPHSPTPYLIKRAVTWGRLPLPELMQEVLREEGDLNRYFSMLGIRGE